MEDPRCNYTRWSEHNQQSAFLLTQTKLKNKKVAMRPKEGVSSKPKSMIRINHIESLAVCKEVFKDMHNVSNHRISTLLFTFDKNSNKLPKD